VSQRRYNYCDVTAVLYLSSLLSNSDPGGSFGSNYRFSTDRARPYVVTAVLYCDVTAVLYLSSLLSNGDPGGSFGSNYRYSTDRPVLY
jgi:hypothetical protein